MTLDDVKAMDTDFISASVAASVLKMDTGRLIGYAKAGQLPFPVSVIGSRVKIPREAFLRQYGALEEENKRTDQILDKLREMNVALTVLVTIMGGIMKRVAPEEYALMGKAIKGEGSAKQ